MYPACVVPPSPCDVQLPALPFCPPCCWCFSALLVSQDSAPCSLLQPCSSSTVPSHSSWRLLSSFFISSPRFLSLVLSNRSKISPHWTGTLGSLDAPSFFHKQGLPLASHAVKGTKSSFLHHLHKLMHLFVQGCASSSEDGQTLAHKLFWSTACMALHGAGEGGQLEVSRSQQRLELGSRHIILPTQNFL